MQFIYHILDTKKEFSYKGKKYLTPCCVTVNTVPQNRTLRHALEENGIKNVRVERSNKGRKLSKKVPLNNGDGTVTLGAFIGR